MNAHNPESNPSESLEESLLSRRAEVVSMISVHAQSDPEMRQELQDELADINARLDELGVKY